MLRMALFLLLTVKSVFSRDESAEFLEVLNDLRAKPADSLDYVRKTFLPFYVKNIGIDLRRLVELQIFLGKAPLRQPFKHNAHIAEFAAAQAKNFSTNSPSHISAKAGLARQGVTVPALYRVQGSFSKDVSSTMNMILLLVVGKPGDDWGVRDVLLGLKQGHIGVGISSLNDRVFVSALLAESLSEMRSFLPDSGV